MACRMIDLKSGTLYPFFESGLATDMAASAAALAFASLISFFAMASSA